MFKKPVHFPKLGATHKFHWVAFTIIAILAMSGLAFTPVQPALATATNSANPTPNTMTWTDPGGSGLQVSFTTVKTYSSCTSVGDNIYTTGIPADWSLNGYVNISINQADGTWQIHDSINVAQKGDLSLTIPYPPAWTWPIINGTNTREIHVDISINVTDQYGDPVNWVGGDPKTPGVLGPSQDWDVFCSNTFPGPQLSIVKTTNGADAKDPNGADVPNISANGAITWIYQVTNTGQWPIAKSYITVTDNQPGVVPVFDSEVSGNGDDILDPGEIWNYKATGTALNLVSPPAGVIVQPGVCTHNGAEPPRTAYTNIGTVSVKGISESDASSYCNPPNPAVTIVKYTNGQQANDPNGSDVPRIQPGDTVTWTYKVTNTGNTSIAKANVVVTDNQTGVTPAFDMEISGNGDEVFDPGEVWQYVATGIAVDLTNPPAGVITEANACTLNQTEPPRTAYVNQGTATIPGASDTVQSSYCNPVKPGIAIIKYTNGKVASDPNGTDLPQLKPGDPVTWTYQVTNTGGVSYPRADVVVTDNQPGVTPAFDHEITGNGDNNLDPGEVWLYKATGTAVDTTLPPQGVNIVHSACSYNNSMPQSPAYVNTGTVTVPDATASANSSYCNPVHYPYFGENGYIGVEDWYNGDYDYNDFGFYFRIEETIEYVCPPGGTCGPYLTHITVTTNAVIFDSGMRHLIHLHRAFNGPVHYTVSRVVPADPNTLTLFDGTTGKETPAGSYVSASGDVDVVLYNDAKYTWPQKQINEPVVVDFSIDQPLLNPRVSGTYVRSYTVGSTTFHDLDPIMSEYDFWEEGTKFQSRWHLKDTRPVGTNNEQILVPPSRKIPDGTVLPFLLVVPYTNWIPPFEGTTITSPYASFGTFYTTSSPGDWYLPSKVTDNCVAPYGISFGPYPGPSSCPGSVYVPIIIK